LEKVYLVNVIIIDETAISLFNFIKFAIIITIAKIIIVMVIAKWFMARFAIIVVMIVIMIIAENEDKFIVEAEVAFTLFKDDLGIIRD